MKKHYVLALILFYGYQGVFLPISQSPEKGLILFKDILVWIGDGN